MKSGHRKLREAENGIGRCASSGLWREPLLFLGGRSCLAFSLVELLLVIAVMAVLMALVIPATGSVMRSMNLNRAASLLSDELNFARQTALSRNRDVEVRFFKMGSKVDANDKQYRAFRSYLAEGTNTVGYQPLSRLKSLPESIIITSEAAYSTLLDVTNPARSGLSSGTEDLPGAVGTEYVRFLFRANGATSLRPVSPPEGNWFLTLYAEGAKIEANGLPTNYYTAQVDPVTGRVRSYRP